MFILIAMDKKSRWLTKPFSALLAATLLVGLFLGGSLTAAASGESLEVVSQDTQVRFSEGVTFSVAVEGDVDIVEVKLSYRNANGGPWSYTYLDLDPSPRVETTFTLDTSGGTYVPPGAAVEYFYTIRDAEGNVKKTDPQTLIYTDTRFEWQSTTIGPLILLWHDQPRRRVQALEETLRESIGRVEDLLQIRLEQPMRGVIYNTRDEASEAFPNLSTTIDEEQIFHGFAFSDWNLFTGVGLSADLITHETTHLLLHQATISARPGIPSWLNEGFASYVEPGSRPASPESLERLQPREMPLRTMGAVPGRLSDIGFFYRKSESVVAYLLETYGEEEFRDFLGRLNQGKRIDDALTATYGFDQNGLERQWLASPLGESHGEDSEDDGNLFLQLESAFLGGLVLLVVTVVAARFLFRRLVTRPRPDLVDDDPDDYFRYPDDYPPNN
ncbi:MAG: peptidase MA family metallohydrolase [Chloroflexi bacterium]|nr:peptidase MA family metallohydrolase [Chloroflexota bacterium]